jgi:hypothetical protein
MTAAAMSSERVFRSFPFGAFPTAVLDAATMNASRIETSTQKNTNPFGLP